MFQEQQPPYEPGSIVRSWRQTGSLSLREIQNADEPTEIVAVVRSIRPRVLRPNRLSPATPRAFSLALDTLARPYICVRSALDTDTLVERYVELYKQASGQWPTIILLSRDRWMLCGERMVCYAPEASIRIPYGYEGRNDYDILVRGQSYASK